MQEEVPKEYQHSECHTNIAGLLPQLAMMENKKKKRRQQINETSSSGFISTFLFLGTAF